MSRFPWDYVNTDSEEVRPHWTADDVEDDNKTLNVTLTSDYVRFWADSFEHYKYGGAWASIGVIVLCDYLTDLRDSLASSEEGVVVDTECAYESHRLTITRDAVGALKIELERDGRSNPETVTINLPVEESERLAQLIDAQVEELARVEAEKVSITKPRAEWKRVITALRDENRYSWPASVIEEQIAEYRNDPDDWELTVVFADQHEADQAFEVTQVELAATVDEWDAVVEALRADRSELLALGVEDQLDGHRFGASPVQAVGLVFDWNEAPEIEAVMWRRSVFGVREVQAV